MARRYDFPDPNTRSANDPIDTASSEQVLDLYNHAHPDDEPYQKVSQTVKDWFTTAGKGIGWDDIQFSESEAILTRKIEKVGPKE